MYLFYQNDKKKVSVYVGAFCFSIKVMDSAKTFMMDRFHALCSFYVYISQGRCKIMQNEMPSANVKMRIEDGMI